MHVSRTRNTLGHARLYVLSHYPAKPCHHPFLIGCESSMTPLSLCSFQDRCHQGMGRPWSVTPSSPSEALGIPCIASPYMLRPGTHEIHVQPCHIFDIHWSYSAELDAPGDHTFCTRLSSTLFACDRFDHT
jgi:hypothetical protein